MSYPVTDSRFFTLAPYFDGLSFAFFTAATGALFAGAATAGWPAGTGASCGAPASLVWVQPGTLVYLDGKPSTLTEIQRLGKETISSGEGVELAAKDPANQLFGPIMAPAAELITAKANATSPAVQNRAAGAIRYYLNDKPIAAETIEKLDQNTIASVEIVRGTAAATYTHAATVGGVVLLKTKRPY